MGLGLPAYRITVDDLVDADKKTARAIGPLLDALNRTLSLVISVLNALALPTPKVVSFTTVETGAAYVDLGLGKPAVDVWVSGLVPTDGTTLASVYSMSWIPMPVGARLLFVGLAPLTTYALRVQWS